MNPITPADLDALSAYLDNQLPPAERAALEARLAAEPALRAELDSLRAVQQALAGLPPLRAPRNLTLTPAQARPVRRVAVFPAFVSGLSAVAAALLLVAGFAALRPVTTLPTTNAVAAAPTTTWTAPPPLESPAARAMEATLAPTEREGSAAGFADGMETAEEPFADTNATEADLASAAQSGQAPAILESQDAAAAESLMAGAAPAANAADAALAAPPPTESPELAMQAPAPQATAPADETRTKEATPTAAPSETPRPTMTPSATPAPTATAVPTPAPTIVKEPGVAVAAPLSAWGLIALGGLLLVVALVAWRFARRAR